MNILEQLPKQPIKTAPDVWVKRLAIYSKLTVKPIRDIPLRRGLNIVWAEEPEAEEDASDVAGHSAGKTTFCRLMRYVLGEKTFGNKANAGLIKKSFPAGYVGAEVIVKGIQWAVLRPLGENRNSYVLKNATIEEIVANKGEPAYQENYPKKIGLDALLDDLESSTVVRTNEEIRWGHLLAWCTRDQEARFQNIYDWRSPRSESEWPSFRFPKSDPLFVMRVVLGLFLPNELRSEESLSKLQQLLETAETELETARKEPDYWCQHHDLKLRNELKGILPNDSSEIDVAPIVSDQILPDLKRYTAKAKFLVGEEIATMEAAQLARQSEIDALNEAIAQNRKDLAHLSGLFELEAKAGVEVDTGLKEKEEFRKNSAELKNQSCPLGNVLIGECTYVRERQEVISRDAIKDAHTLEQMEARRASEQKRIEDQKTALQRSIDTDIRKRTTLTQQKTTLVSDVEKKKLFQGQLGTDLEDLKTWKACHDAPEKYEKLKQQVRTIEAARKDIEAKKRELTSLIAEHDANRDLLNTIFSGAARNVLPSSAYDGKVSLEDRELNFQITHGGNMSGEAMETLAVLLTDISCLIYNSLSSRSFLPGFLLHDSPREADLGLRLYQRYIRFASELDSSFEQLGGCPFQYIITTTSPPPKSLIPTKYVPLRLDASKESELLFRRNLSKPPETDQLELITAQ